MNKYIWRIGIVGPHGPAFLYIQANTPDEAKHKALFGEYLSHGEQVVTVHRSSQMEATVSFLRQLGVSR